MKITHFKSPAEFRKWLAPHHGSARELWIGYYKKASGKPSMTWPESVDEALCYGWIDGIRKRVDETSYTIRFTPRKPRSVWSVINTRRAGELIRVQRMRAAGLKAFRARLENRSGIYSYEQRSQQLPPPYAKKLMRNKAAWEFYQAQAAGYRKTANWWVVSAKKEETRLKRLERLIADSAGRQKLAQLKRTVKST